MPHNRAKTHPGQFKLADYPELVKSPDPDTDPDPFKKEEVTAKHCAWCGRGYDYFTIPELEQWLSQHMPRDQAKAIAKAFARDRS